MFALARANGVTNFVHSRFMAEGELGGSVDAIQELLSNGAATGAGCTSFTSAAAEAAACPCCWRLSTRRNSKALT